MRNTLATLALGTSLLFSSACATSQNRERFDYREPTQIKISLDEEENPSAWKKVGDGVKTGTAYVIIGGGYVLNAVECGLLVASVF